MAVRVAGRTEEYHHSASAVRTRTKADSTTVDTLSITAAIGSMATACLRLPLPSAQCKRPQSRSAPRRHSQSAQPARRPRACLGDGHYMHDREQDEHEESGMLKPPSDFMRTEEYEQV